MNRSRTGMTVIELLIVMSIIGTLALIALPKTGAIFEKLGVRSAKQEIASSVASARVAAIQNGANTSFIRDGNSIMVQVEMPGAAPRVIVGNKDLNSHYGVRLDGSEEIRFDARGFAYNLSSTAAIGITRGDRRDSVCVLGRGGKVLTTGCTL